MSDDIKNMNAPEDDPDNEIIYLSDESGVEVAFEFVDMVEYKNDEYVILIPAESEDDDENSGEVVILKAEESDDPETESYVSVDDEDTLNAVFDIFKEKFKDIFNFDE